MTDYQITPKVIYSPRHRYTGGTAGDKLKKESMNKEAESI